MNASIICNPKAGKGDGDAKVHAAVSVLEEEGWTAEVRYTTGPGDATQMAREAASVGRDAVIVAGGDGTLNEAVQGLAHTQTALGYLPHGTVNVWAREISIPLNTEGAARAIARGRTEQIDLGMADDRYFLLMAGMGFDAAVLKRARSVEKYKTRLGVLPYVTVMVGSSFMYRSTDVQIRYDGIIRRFQALMVVIGNTSLYGGFFRLTPNAVINDGRLDVCVVKGRGALALGRQVLPILVSRSIKYSDVELLRVKELSVQSNHPLPLHVDGELMDFPPSRFASVPRSLRAIVPIGASSSLFGG